MKKLIFALFTSLLFITSAWGLDVVTNEVTLQDKKSVSYTIEEEGYTNISISLKKSSVLASNDKIIINIINKYDDIISMITGASTSYKTYSFSSTSGESIKKIEIINETSYKISFKDIKVTKSGTPIQDDCRIKRIETEKSFYSHKGNYIQYDFNDVSTINTKTMIFSARCEQHSTLANTSDMVVQVLCSNDPDGVYRELSYYGLPGWNAKDAGLQKNYFRYSVEIPHNVVSVRFITLANGNTLQRFVEKVDIYRDNVLNSSTNQLNFDAVKIGDYQTLEFSLDYANINKLSATISGNNPENFSIDYYPAENCEEGEQTVKVKFAPTTSCIDNYDATITLFNGQYNYITLSGKRGTNPNKVNKITWTGAEDTNWDNRNNWVKEDGSVLSVADVLSEDLLVTLPAGKERYPVLPNVSTDNYFKTVRDKACDCSQVNAGDNATATMVANKIYIENGAALVGVETLNSGTLRYNEVEMDFTPVRYNSKTGFYNWSLIGPVVKPWNDDKTDVRDVVSGDYYKNDLPHVYMHEAVIEKEEDDVYVQTWNNSFSSLTVRIPHNTAFAIRLPDQYGRNSSGFGTPAKIYNRKNGTDYNPQDDITFTFTGRFYNDAGMPTYIGLTPEVPVLLNNTYPANIDVNKFHAMGLGTIQCYNNEGHSFNVSDVVVPSHYGFVFTPAAGVTELIIPSDCFQTTEVINNRSAEEEHSSLRLQLKNETSDVYSLISVSYDEFKDDVANYAVDAPKVFNDMESNLADLYVMKYSSRWAGLAVPTEESLPLGIKVRSANQTYKFNLLSVNLDSDIILEDRQEGKEYNLSAGEICEISDLAIGECAGRFYLKTSSSEDDNVSTDIYETGDNLSSIEIYANGKNVTVSSSNNIKNIIISDLSGRQITYNVSGQYIVLELPVSSGIYTINVIGDNTSRTEKIRLN